MCEILIFVFTFIAFPGLCLKMQLEFMRVSPTQFSPYLPITVIMIFNVLDTCGRQMGGMGFARKFSIRAVFILVLLRGIAVVLFILFNTVATPSWLFGKDSDWLKMISLIMFSVSNGFLSTCAAIYAPSFVSDDLKPLAGTFTGIFIVAGIVTGSVISNILPFILPPHP